MKRTLKNSLCLLLSLVLLLSMAPMAVFAEETVTDPGKIITEAYALASGENLPYTATLTGEITEINTPYNPDFKNVTVTIEVPGYADKPMYCYRIKGEGADALAVGDTITVTGTITNYHGTIEFVFGSALDAVIKSDTVPEPDWTYPTEPTYTESPTEPDYSWGNYYVAGTASLCGVEWRESATQNQMSDTDGDGIYTITYTGIASGTHKFKITAGTWANCWGWGDDSVGNSVLILTGENNTVEILFNPTAETLDVLVNGAPYVAAAPEDGGVYYVAGAFNGWSANAEGYQMTAAGNGTYTLELTLNQGEHELKVTDGTWTNSWGEGSNNLKFTVDADNTAVLVTFTYESKAVTVGAPGETLIAEDTVVFETYGDAWDNAFTASFTPAADGEITVDITACTPGFGLEVYAVDEMLEEYKQTEAQKITFPVTANTAYELVLYSAQIYAPTLSDRAEGSVSFKITANVAAAAPEEDDSGDAAGTTEENPKLITGSHKEYIAAGTTMWFLFDNTEHMNNDGSYSQMLHINSAAAYAVTYREQPVPVDENGFVSYEMQDMTRQGKYVFSITNNGTAQGLFVIAVASGGGEAIVAPSDPKQIVADAYALGENEALPYKAILTGTITEITEPYSEIWKNITLTITVAGCEDKPIVCYRMKGTGIETLKPGDVIEVTGTLKNYVKTNQETGETTSTIEFTPATLLAVTAGTGGVPMTVKVIAPYGWTGCYVYSWGPDLFGGWPGQQMTKAADGSYSFTLREEVSGILLSCAGSGAMTEDITDLVYTPGSSATITVEALGGNYKHPYTITYGTGNQGGTSGGNTGGNTGSTGPSGSWPEDGDSYTNTLFAWVPDSWGSAINAYTWGYASFGGWPGSPMTYQGGWYRITLPENAYYMIINNGNGNQTYDLELQPNRDVYIVVAESYGHSNAEIYYTPQESLPEVPSYGLYSLAVVGSGLPGIQDWNPADDAGDMTEIRTNVYEKTLTFTEAAEVEFKFFGNDTWDEAWNFGSNGGTELAFGQTVEMAYGIASNNLRLTVPYACTVQITVDLNPYFAGGFPTVLVNRSGNTASTRTLYVKTPDSWNSAYIYTWQPESFGYYPGAAMPMSDGWYAATIPGNMENLILSDYANGRKTDALYLEPDEDVWVVIREDCSATVSYSEPAPELPGLDLRVVGNAPWMGGWDCGSTLGKLQEVDNGVYRVTFQNVTPGDYEFKVLKDGRWDGAVGEVGGGNYSFTVTRDCSVTVTFHYERNYIDGTAEVTYAPKYMGDVSGDQRLNVGDVARLYGHIKRTTLLTDEMALLSGDFMADGRINVGDTARIYSYIKASSPAEQVQAAYQLQPGQLIPHTVTFAGTVVSIPEPYNELTGCITLNMAVAGAETMPILCSRLRGENVERILVGSQVTLKGILQNFYGSIEFAGDCQILNLEGGLDETQMAIVDEAYALPQGQKMNRSVTLTGRVESIQRGSYGTTAVILIPGREDKPITCYRLVGTGINRITTGDTVTVTGTLQNFYGSIEFEAGCQMISYI